MATSEQFDDAKALFHRRSILKSIVSVPLLATFGLLPSPLLRYLKPTMAAGGFFQSADLPKPEQSDRFQWADFPEIWTCYPIMLPLRYEVFNPEGYEKRNTPGFIMRSANNEIVAFSRICPHCHHRQMLNFLKHTSELACIQQSENPVLYCPCMCDCSTFDLCDNGRVLSGPAPRPLRRMEVSFDGKYYTITGLEQYGIA